MCEDGANSPRNRHSVAFSALTLLVGHQEQRLACEKGVCCVSCYSVFEKLSAFVA